MKPHIYNYALNRFRGTPKIAPRLKPKRNIIFGRCNCNGLTISGVCTQCGISRQCCACKKWLWGGFWMRPKPIGAHESKTSHGFCPECLVQMRGEITGPRSLRREVKEG